MTQSITVAQILQRFGLTDGTKQDQNICTCDHQLQGTGAIFLRSMGVLYCNECGGYQLIRKVVK